MTLVENFFHQTLFVDVESLDEHATYASLKHGSPFTHFFAECIADVDLDADAPYGENAMCTKAWFNAIRDVMHVYALWAAVMHSDIDRFASGNSLVQTSIACRSNAKFESYFRSVKHETLNRQLHLRPRRFILQKLTNIHGRLQEKKL